MSRKNSPYVVGDFWLQKRHDGASAGIWQIGWYNPDTRSRHYISTHCRELEDAKSVLDLHHAKLIMDKGVDDDPYVALVCLQYEREYARYAISSSSVCTNIRIFVGFLQQDPVKADARMSDLNPQVFERFRRWRMGAHHYDICWQGKRYARSSAGVVGETVSKNLDDVRAALNYAVTMGRVKTAPRVPRLKSHFRSRPRDIVLRDHQIGAIIGYCTYDPPFLRLIMLQVATAMRPVAAQKMNATIQYRLEENLLDLHPVDAPRTKKRNPIIPVIPEFAPWLIQSTGNFVTQKPEPIKSMKRRWNTMRRELDLDKEIVNKTIRHTVATQLRSLGAPMDQITALLGHKESNGMTAVYAKYDPKYMEEVKTRLSLVWRNAIAFADEWRATHYRVMTGPDKGVFKRKERVDGLPSVSAEYFSCTDPH